MSLAREKITEALQAAQEKREALRDQLNACMGFIQACELLLAEFDHDAVMQKLEEEPCQN